MGEEGEGGRLGRGHRVILRGDEGSRGREELRHSFFFYLPLSFDSCCSGFSLTLDSRIPVDSHWISIRPTALKVLKPEAGFTSSPSSGSDSACEPVQDWTRGRRGVKRWGSERRSCWSWVSPFIRFVCVRERKRERWSSIVCVCVVVMDKNGKNKRS